MINIDDRETEAAIRLLYQSKERLRKPLVVWVGAGASSWAGFPGWEELANKVHSEFRLSCVDYDTESARRSLESGDLPAVFEQCKAADPRGYRRVLAEQLAPRPSTTVYDRFVGSLSRITPLQIVTTNVDELLEQQLATSVSVIQRSDAERAHDLASKGLPFLLKVHGTISHFESMVFTSAEFADVAADTNLLDFLRQVVSQSTVLFLGYGLRDTHVVKLLQESDTAASLIGDGPHFAVVPRAQKALPESVKQIQYTPDPAGDHRDSIRILEEIVIWSSAKTDQPPPPETSSENRQSAHFLFDLYPTGTWKTSQTLNLQREDGSTSQGIIGPGYTNDEVRGSAPDALHDLAVGLLCFETIYASSEATDRFHNTLGPEFFWRLVRERTLRFVHWHSHHMVMFPEVDAVSGGRLESWTGHNPDLTEKTVGELIRSQIRPVPGKEEIAERRIQGLVSNIHEIRSGDEGDISGITRSLLLRPSVQELLGISGGLPSHSITRWSVFPILRLAKVVRVGTACSLLGISSAKISFGAASLAGPAFAAAFGAESCDDTAGFVVSGRFGASLGEVIRKDPSILTAILRFRETSAAVDLRREVLEALQSNAAADAAVAINGGLSKVVPFAALQKARDRFIGLYVPSQIDESVPPAIWNDSRDETEVLSQWRARSLNTLQRICADAGIGPYDPCPCGSGEKLRFCCEGALRR